MNYNSEAPFECMIVILFAVTHYLALPNGYSYSGRLYDNITIPFVLGSDPLINITRSLIFGITVYDTTQGRAAMIMPEIRRLTAYRGEIVYNLAPFSLAGDYTLRITVEGNLIASTDFSIAITSKSVCNSSIAITSKSVCIIALTPALLLQVSQYV